MFAQSISRLLTNADNTLLLLRKFYESHPDETAFHPVADRCRIQERPQVSVLADRTRTASSAHRATVRPPSVSTFRTWSISRPRLAATEDRLFVSKPVMIRVHRQMGPGSDAQADRARTDRLPASSRRRSICRSCKVCFRKSTWRG